MPVPYVTRAPGNSVERTESFDVEKLSVNIIPFFLSLLHSETSALLIETIVRGDSSACVLPVDLRSPAVDMGTCAMLIGSQLGLACSAFCHVPSG